MNKCKVVLSEAILWLLLQIALIHQFSVTGGIKIFVNMFLSVFQYHLNVSPEKTHSNLTSVLLKKEYVAHDLYFSLYIDLEGNETPGK